MNENNGLPKDWKVVKLGEVCDRITKGGTPTTYGFQFQERGIRFLKVENVKNGRVLIDSIKDFISEEAHNFQKKSQLISGDVLFSIAGTIGETCVILPEYLPANTNQAFAIIRGTQNHFQTNFLKYLLNFFVAKLKEKSRGGAMNNISLEDLKNFEAILPPLPVQQRIVEKIEELFREVDAGVANLRQAKAQLKTYRQAVLKWAFEGRLTHDDVKEGELPKGWELKKLGEVAEVKRGKSKHRPRDDKKLYGGVYPFIQTGEVRAANGGIIKKYTQTYSELGLQQSKLWKKGTLCLTIAANIAETAFLGFDACFPDSIVGVTADENVLSLKYINFFIQKLKKEIDSKASATAQKNINVEFLDNIDVPYCKVEEQDQIVQEIESRLSVADKLEEAIDHSLQQAEALKQSILKQAFEGKLVAGEENNQPVKSRKQSAIEKMKV